MIKLIASDIDGTLLVEGSDKLNPELYDVILKLKEKDILFAAASGRTYESIRSVFEPVANDIFFICENGSNVVCRGHQLSSSSLDRKAVEEVIRYSRTLPNSCFNVSTTEAMYTEDRDEEYLRLLTDGYHVNLRVVDDLLAENLDVIKMSIYHEPGILEIVDEIDEMVEKHWKGKFHTAIAGDPWYDFMDINADKGNALKSIQRAMCITLEETMAFGDNINDIGMIKAAGESYAVANAKPEVKAAAKHIAEGHDNDGVLKVLKKLLEEQEA